MLLLREMFWLNGASDVGLKMTYLYQQIRPIGSNSPPRRPVFVRNPHFVHLHRYFFCQFIIRLNQYHFHKVLLDLSESSHQKKCKLMQLNGICAMNRFLHNEHELIARFSLFVSSSQLLFMISRYIGSYYSISK